MNPDKREIYGRVKKESDGFLLGCPIVREVYLLKVYLTKLLVGYTAKCQMISWIVCVEVDESLTCPMSHVWQSGLNKLNWIVLNVEGSSHVLMWFFPGIYVEGLSRPMRSVSRCYRQSLGRNLNWGSPEYQARVLPTQLCDPICCSLNVERWNTMMTVTGFINRSWRKLVMCHMLHHKETHLCFWWH